MRQVYEETGTQRQATKIVLLELGSQSSYSGLA